MGQRTPFIGIYVPAAGETNYDQSFSDGMMNVDAHDHSGGPNKGVPISASGLADASVTYQKLNANVVDPTTGIGTDIAPFQNRLVMLGILKNLFVLSGTPGVGFVSMNGSSVASRTFQDTSTVTWTNPDGVSGNPSASFNIAGISPITVPDGGTGITSAPVPYAPILAGTTNTNPFQQPASAGNSGDVYVSQGASAVGAFASLASLGQLQTANLTLTAQEVRDLKTTPIQIVAAPGAGKVLVPISLYGLLNSDGTPFGLASGSGSIALAYDTGVFGSASCVFNNLAFITVTTDTYWWATQQASSGGSLKSNTQDVPLYLYDSATTPYTGGGNSTIDFTLTYITITL